MPSKPWIVLIFQHLQTISAIKKQLGFEADMRISQQTQCVRPRRLAMVIAGVAKNGVRFKNWRLGNMPSVGGVTDASVKAITAYARALPTENRFF